MKFFIFLILLPSFIFASEKDPLQLEDVVVSSPLMQKKAATVLPINILEGDALRLKTGNSIGDTLKHELGIHNASFGAGVGQPVIRGQTGSRVRVLQNGLGSLDVSNLSPDHANSTEPLLADRIEVLRGPATLLYGSGAIGGIVNVLDNRIPDRLKKSLETALEQRFNSVSNETSSVLKHDGSSGKFAWHLDGFYRQRDNITIAGNAVDESVAGAFNSHGFMANSDAESWSGTVGGSWVDDWGFIGFSVNYLDNQYGIPPSAEEVRIALTQTRYDMKAEIKQPFAFVDSLKLRLGVNDYQHNEIEESGEVGTTFENDGVEGRVELLHQPFLFIDQGVLGFQMQSKQFSAVGEEAFVPPSDILSYGIFAVENIFYKNWTYEFGFRVEQQSIQAEGWDKKTHTPVSASASALWDVDDENTVGLSFSYAQRAPDVQELFAQGVHFATHSYEKGNANLSVETAYNLELNFKTDYDWVSAELNLFHSWNKDYINQYNKGEFFNLETEIVQSNCSVTDVCLSILETRQSHARFYGFESKIQFPVWDSEQLAMDLTLFGDYVRATFDEGGDVPRQPPLRYGVQIDYNNQQNLSANLRFTRIENQNHAGDHESNTRGYFLLSSAAHYQMDFKHSKLILFAKGNNLLNKNSRNASSFLRNFAPEAGRGVELGLRISF
ncbi:MAG: TonB-dependent receptor [Methylococcales bacterium]|nr:TonB-dependent receptor [Methylococcales bacterium]